MTPANDNQPQQRPTSFDALLAKYTPFLRKQCNLLVPTASDDAFQEVYARALETWHKYRPNGHFPTWLNYMVRHYQVEVAREQRRNLGQATPTATVSASQTLAMELQEAVATIPERYKTEIIMTALGCEQTEIAVVKGVTRQAIGQRLAVARAQMRAANDNSPAEKPRLRA